MAGKEISMQSTLYLAILPIGLGMITFVLSLICFFGYLTSDDNLTKRQLWPWFTKLLLLAFLLLSIGVFFTTRHF